MNKATLITLTVVLLFCGQGLSQTGTKKRRPLPYEYGRVIINNYSEQADLRPVVFEHWIHRSKFTCRVCHVDIGFVMKAGATGITATANAQGYYCGTCHNGNMVVGGKKVFASCRKPDPPGTSSRPGLIVRRSAEEAKQCERCHSLGRDVASNYDFFAFSEPLPKARFGNGIDWEKAEELGFINPASFLDGVSIPRKSLPVQKDFALDPKVQGMPDIIFSHKKHTVWNGCELCHPDIFAGKRGDTQYSMVEISEGKFCGACHTAVAFPLTDCQRCHSKPVEP
jgi:c(7)-type cytochrome triheme protein